MITTAQSLNMENFDLDSFRKQITEDDTFILDLIDRIPPKFYFDQEVQEKLIAEKHAKMDKVAEDIKKKFPKNQELSAKSKHKRARLDPHQHQSVSQIQQLMDNEEEKIKIKKRPVFVTPSATLTRAANIQELQRRLQERIQELRRKRGMSKELFEERKRLKSKIKKIKQRQKKGNLNKVTVNGKNESTDIPKKNNIPNIQAKPIYNKEGKIIYSKFDFAEPGEPQTKKKQKKKKLKTLLHDAEKSKQKIETMKETDPNKANEILQKTAWQRAIQKAEGVKLKDDPTLLKKSLKKQEKQKKKSSAQWKQRKEHTKKLMEDRQEKRKRNIQAKKKEKIAKKIKKAKKKGRIIPGF